jgi:NAD(P)-dependent dehydrogenase (short-subunit alcohol dehydrogenase family)
MALNNNRILVIGGSSGIGFAISKLALKENTEVIIASRSSEKLNRARNLLEGNVSTESVDFRDEESLADLFKKIGNFDDLVITASEIEFGPVVELPTKKAKSSFDSKFWGPYLTVKKAIPYINKAGSITLFSGAFSQHPKVGAAIIAAINSAIEGFARTLALEIAPVRVNVIAPGLTDTEHFDSFTKAEKSKFFSSFCKNLPIARAAKPEEIAESALYAMKNTYLTGATLYIDGGYTI